MWGEQRGAFGLVSPFQSCSMGGFPNVQPLEHQIHKKTKGWRLQAGWFVFGLHRNLRDFCAVTSSSHLSAGVAGKWPEGRAGKVWKFGEERQKGGTYLYPCFLGGINQHRPAGKWGLRAWRAGRECTLCFHVPGH